MGLGNFFRRVGSGISNVASKAWSGAKNVGGKVWEGVKYVGKAAKPVVNVAQKVAGFAEKIPGMIGEAGKLVKGGLDKVNEWIDMIPSGTIKDKLKEASSGGAELINKGEGLARRGGGIVSGFVEKTKPWLGYAEKLVNNASEMGRK